VQIKRGKEVLLVGANGGVGKAVAAGLLGRGHSVTATVSRREKIDAFEKECPGCNRVLALDMSDAEKVRETAKEIIAGMKRLDAVFVAAAASFLAPLELSLVRDIRNLFEINCLSNLALYQAAIPALRLTGGRLIFTGSLSGRVGTPMQGAYVASKFALEGAVDVMRREASGWGVEIVLLQPGAINTPLLWASRDALVANIAGLSMEHNDLYGKRYKQMLYRVDQAMSADGIMPPEAVAAVAIEALEGPDPLPRYPIGTDADFLINASRTKPDRELDALILSIYESAPI
jgi:NAD(P)-dependent dehydrogenase (short-subunit alcohol dehydrogenase family)